MSKPREHEVKCFCGSPMRLRFTKKFKGGNWFYGCSRYPECDGTHGCHQDNGKPLGVPANKVTKEWRIKAHDAFDTLWKGPEGFMTRKQAYECLAKVFGVTEIHIGESNIETCQQIIGAVHSLKEDKVMKP